MSKLQELITKITGVTPDVENWQELERDVELLAKNPEDLQKLQDLIYLLDIFTVMSVYITSEEWAYA